MKKYIQLIISKINKIFNGLRDKYLKFESEEFGYLWEDEEREVEDKKIVDIDTSASVKPVSTARTCYVNDGIDFFQDDISDNSAYEFSDVLPQYEGFFQLDLSFMHDSQLTELSKNDVSQSIKNPVMTRRLVVKPTFKGNYEE